ncbi:MAG: hypothetical protein JO199_07500, partial [Candidatus Eremiobacteraeota bacterium]|nr:hypothetical protein [Candidatus Eremiobacteraeota bacterium]
MKTLGRFYAFAAVVLLAACSGVGTHNSTLPPFANSPGVAYTGNNPFLQGHHFFRACPQAKPGEYQCMAVLSDLWYSDMIRPDGSSCLHQPGCYGPTDLQAAYGVTSLAKTGGKGQTVAIVDAYGYPTAAKDLAAYRTFFKLPACGAGCLTIVNQKGQTTGLPKPNAGWDGEQALDLDMVSAICPNCKILLVESNSSSTSDLVTGVVVANSKAMIVSNSWGGPEEANTYPAFDSHKGVILASAGDSGAGAPAYGGYPASPEQQPCGFAGVICVG